MCGRYVIDPARDELTKLFGLEDAPALAPRYNVAPSQDVPIVHLGEAGRELAMVRWGLVPFWAKEPKTRYSMINARAETVADKPAYRAAFRRRRCLVPARGFYEWKSQGKGKPKQPYFIHRDDGRLMAFAGLWERWEGGEGEVLESYTIIVTAPNERVGRIHDRMPAILEPERFDACSIPRRPSPPTRPSC